MRVKTKKLASLVTASILAFSATIGGVGITASAADNTFVLLKQSYNSDKINSYTSGAYLLNNWNNESTLYGGTSTLGSDTYGKYSAFQINAKNAIPLNGATNIADGISSIDAERYRIWPLLKTDKADPQNANMKYLKDVTGGADALAHATISIDMMKGPNYDNATAVSGSDNLAGFRIGLAHVYYAGGSKKYTKSGDRYVYPADIAWIDVTENIQSLNKYKGAAPYSSLVGQVSFNISDVINNGTHKYINGADSSSTYALTAENANAVVFGIILKNNVVNDVVYYDSENDLFFDNITLSTPADVSATAVTEKNSDDTYKAGIVFDEINPSDYANVVFKVGDNYYGSTVENAFDTVINGPANIGVILNDATDPDVSVWFTNKDLTYATTVE